MRGERLLNQRNFLEAEQSCVKSNVSAPSEWPRLGASKAFCMGTPESVSLGEVLGEMERSRMDDPQKSSVRFTDSGSQDQSLLVVSKYASNSGTARTSRVARGSPGPSLRTLQG